jgi:hypothetical protein
MLFTAFHSSDSVLSDQRIAHRNRNDFCWQGCCWGGIERLQFHPLSTHRGVHDLSCLFFELKTKQERNNGCGCSAGGGNSFFGVPAPFRYWLENPLCSVTGRRPPAACRTTYPGNPLWIFLQNFWKAMTMFFYDNGEIWVHSVPDRPAWTWSALLFISSAVSSVWSKLSNKRTGWQKQS